MLEIRSVRKTYDDRVVVNDVSFEVQPGEIFALLGPNGAGKTTLIRMITDIIKPDGGQILMNGQPLAGSGRTKISYLPEERGLYRKVPVLDALSYIGELKDMGAAKSRAAAVALLEEFGLAAWAKKQVSALSKGMQQKVQLCSALIGDPELLILDEPFSGLDPVNVQILEDVLRRRRAAGTTVILSTHQMNKVEQQCDRALMINRGHMVLYGTVRDIRQQYAEHAVLVEGGEVPGGVAGVKAMERVNGGTKLSLERGAAADQVLRALLDRGVTVKSFAPVVPPLEDVFVHVVNTGAGLDQGRSGPPTVDEELARGGAR
ncbi:MAG: ATP-binding cassette domain-containing protein [Candidatus Eisenbacteria bacterium]|uniref:ATP-binding cassette domain-containing protein n=1 Tax=Eiseniibacteriota bacterium TaxID=2212470 RepID=A0A933SGA0_UNCEI|nr:ATP-binding cassette domain-containing protein [Candidatus Eisenbacteria bacterium]